MSAPSAIPPLPPELAEALSGLPDEARAALEATWRGATPSPSVYQPTPERKAQARAFLEAALAPALQPVPVPRKRLAPRPPAPARTALRHRLPWRALAMAAVVVFLVGVGALWLQQPTTQIAPYGQTVAVLLPDGSQVELNSGAALTWRNSFGWLNRDVQLNGEAFFTVQPGTTPFVVETFNATTTVLGTRFNVRAWSGDPHPSTRVTVVSGKVALRAQHAAAPTAHLTAGYYSELRAPHHQPSAPDTVSMSQVLAWRTGGLAFQNVPFGTIFADLERRFDLQIQASTPLKNRPFVYFKQQPVSAQLVLGELTQAAGLRYRATAQGFEVYEP
jgi:ferric-dicitrate binding protein FerR (iron transport regulator)